jgi:prepilin-type N-terminal cleavage/methylation domain-containing protein
MNQKRTQERGFTLTEVLVAMAIFAIIFIAALLIYDRSNLIFKESVESGDAQQHTRAAFDKLTADLRMMGFDYDRDGVPTTGNREQQPDEQLEYMGSHAITIRGNFNYDMDAANEFGREKDYEPPTGQFAIVTTSNAEIVTYVLRSDKGSNDDEIVFYADTKKPRATFTGGSDEQKVTIPGVNLCSDGCNDPPYTLYRVTLKDADLENPGAPSDFNFTPVANNIRSLQFTYYSSVPALDEDVIEPIGGDGQYKISAANTQETISARLLRSSVKAVRVRIVGMTSAPVSGSFRDPVEMRNETPHPVALRHRQFPLEAVIQPRNIGIRGMEEFDVTAPLAPTITQVCVGSCGIVRVEWNPPPAGTVDSYTVFWDSSTTGNCSTCAYSNAETVGSQTTFFAAVGDPTKTWYFQVIASNSFGASEPSNESAGVVPINHTKPTPPVMISASGGDPDGPPAQPNDITLVWQLSKENVGSPSDSCGNPIPESPSYAESRSFNIYRHDQPDFDPATEGTLISGTPSIDVGSGIVTFVDRTAKLSCTPYYYRVQVKELCDTAATNLGGDTDLGLSDFSDEIVGQSIPAYPPRRPQNLLVANDEPVIDPLTSEVTGAAVTLSWDEVTEDTGNPGGDPPVAPSPILVRNYIVERTLPDGSKVELPLVTDATIGDGTVTTTETISPAPDPTQPHEYRVKAVLCHDGDAEIEGALSDEVKYPCSQMFIEPLGAGILDGSGTSQDDPLVITTSIQLKVTTTKAIALIEATMSGEPLTVTGLDPQERYIGVPVPASADAHAVQIIYTDIEGCSVTRTRWVLSAPSGCCLAPFRDAGGGTFDATVVEKVNDTTLRVRLVNLCSDNLALDSFNVEFVQLSKTPPGDPTKWTPRLSTITFPEQGGGTVTHNFGGIGTHSPATVTMSSIPSADTTIPGSSSYTMLFTFSNLTLTGGNAQTLVAAPTGAANEIFIQNLCIVYDREDDLQSSFCRVAQEAGSCSF